MGNLGEILDGLRRDRWGEEGLVGNFKLQLEECGVEILRMRGNGFCLKGKSIKLLLSVHEYTPQTVKTEGKGWWAVSQNFIDEAETATEVHQWGVVCFLGHSKSEAWTGYWVSGDKFDEVDAGSPDSDGKRHIYLEKLERVADKFISVREFCDFTELR